MSDAVTVALIGAAGTAVGAVATILAARIQAFAKANPKGAEKTTALGEVVDIRELRILRALYGEPRGRYLEIYQKDGYYTQSLEAVVAKGWVSRIEKRYFMTAKGLAYCRAYLKELDGSWNPTVQG